VPLSGASADLKNNFSGICPVPRNFKPYISRPGTRDTRPGTRDTINIVTKDFLIFNASCHNMVNQSWGI